LVLTPLEYNRRAGLAVVCPITNQVKGYPFEVLIPRKLQLSGAILADHVKSLDWQARKAKPAGKCPIETLEEVQGKLRALLDL
jgi:mRNA interferase MazF